MDRLAGVGMLAVIMVLRQERLRCCFKVIDCLLRAGVSSVGYYCYRRESTVYLYDVVMFILYLVVLLAVTMHLGSQVLGSKFCIQKLL